MSRVGFVTTDAKTSDRFIQFLAADFAFVGQCSQRGIRDVLTADFEMGAQIRP